VISIETSTDLNLSSRDLKGRQKKKRMGNARKVEDDDNNNNNNNNKSSSSVLIAATMCIIGLQVHVHVKDGSVFSGIFFTASVDNGFGKCFDWFHMFLSDLVFELSYRNLLPIRDLNGIFYYWILLGSVNFNSNRQFITVYDLDNYGVRLVQIKDMYSFGIVS